MAQLVSAQLQFESAWFTTIIVRQMLLGPRYSCDWCDPLSTGPVRLPLSASALFRRLMKPGSKKYQRLLSSNIKHLMLGCGKSPSKHFLSCQLFARFFATFYFRHVFDISPSLVYFNLEAMRLLSIRQSKLQSAIITMNVKKLI